MEVSIWFWVGFNAFILAALALDLGLLGKRAHEIQLREAAIRTGIWVILAMLFALGIYVVKDSEAALTFLTGYIIEESLSVDNIFVMVVIFSYFKVPPALQHRVLFWGIIGALIMRGIFILVGAWLLHHFSFVIYLFGGLLLVTGIRMAVKQEKEFDGEDNPVVKLFRRVMPISPGFDGKKFFTTLNGRRAATPLLLVLVLVEVTDLIFAVDSIPAIFAVTQDTFLVYTSNVFAILGLRSMYFLLAGVVDKFRFLRFGLAFILSFVGIKMILADHVHIPTLVSLAVVVGGLAASIALSLLIPEKEEEGAQRESSDTERRQPVQSNHTR
ncbi:MAG TPA: TerC family protein [Longimicrobiales bacterium]|nr:TerC family protein [Longimicrobiales bacterium]